MARGKGVGERTVKGVQRQSHAFAVLAAQGQQGQQGSEHGQRGWSLFAAAAFGSALLASSLTTSECEGASEPINKDGWQVDNDKFKGMKIFTGNSNKALAQDVVNQLGLSLGKIQVSHFPDGEVNVQVNENVRGKDVYIIQPTSPPVNETLMELLLMISTMRRASARKITAIIPYYGYARQDRKMQARVPISAADVARLLEAMGVDRVVAVDLHCGQIQGFFGPRVPVDNLDGGTVGVSYFGDMDLVNPVIVSPDAGGVYRAKQFREALSKKHEVDCSLAMIIKQRAKASEIERMDLVGSVDGCDAIIVDDMVDTAGTLCKAAEILKEHGARRVFAFASHGVFSGPAPSRIANSVLTELVVLDTVPLSEASRATGKITQLSVGPLLAHAIYNIHNRKSLSALFR
jgi:ribose-phosphate pyrophosphokinase